MFNKLWPAIVAALIFIGMIPLRVRAAALETAKATPVGYTVWGALTDNLSTISLGLGAVYTAILIGHKLYQVRKEIKHDRAVKGNG